MTNSTPAFIKGISFADLGRSSSPGIIENVKLLGCNSILYRLPWKDIEPIVESVPYLDDVRSGKHIDDYKGIWDRDDLLISNYKASGLEILMIVGQDDVETRPNLADGTPVTPDSLGKDGLLAANYRHIRAVVRRYKKDVKNWIIGAEMNEAKLRILYKWLEGQAYNEFDYLTKYVENQYRAVKDEDANANVILMMQTDIHSDIHHDFRTGLSGSLVTGPYDWVEALERWKSYCDMVALNMYPNYYVATPVYVDAGERIRKALKYKPVIIGETNYPCLAYGEKPNDLFMFTQEHQEQYLVDSYKQAIENGASGFFCFNLYSPGVQNIYTEQDVKNFNILAAAFRNGDAKKLIDFLLANMLYCMGGRLSTVLDNHDLGLGIIIRGNKTKAYYSIARLFYGLPLDAPLVDYTVSYNKGHNYIYVHPDCFTNILEALADDIQVIWRFDAGKWYSAPKGSSEYVEMIKNCKGGIFYCKLARQRTISSLIYAKEQYGLLIASDKKMDLVGYNGIVPVNASGETTIISNDGSNWIRYPEQTMELKPGHAYWMIK